LIVTMDDATSRILSIFLVEQEGTASSFRGLAETIRAHGLFSSFYTDRGSHYFHTPKADEKVDKARLTQVGRALLQLRIEHLPSYSPQGRGRVERLWRTLQGRLPPLLRQAGIGDVAAANRWLAEVYMGAHNARFAVEPAEEGTAFIPFAGALDDILCVEEERVVGADNTVRYQNRVLQIPQSRHRHHFVKVKVRVREYGDGSLAIFHGPRKIADYDASGGLKQEAAKTRFAA
jgi:transposase InsO family protein